MTPAATWLERTYGFGFGLPFFAPDSGGEEVAGKFRSKSPLFDQKATVRSKLRVVMRGLEVQKFTVFRGARKGQGRNRVCTTNRRRQVMDSVGGYVVNAPARL